MIVFVLGLAATGSYLLCSLIAYLHYPAPFSPLHGDLLGQLGDHNLNPGGATVYLIGCALCGTFTLAFFFCLASWRDGGTRTQKRLLILVQCLGMLGGVGLVMTGMYPEEFHGIHRFWSNLVFGSFGMALLLSPTVVWRRGHASPDLVTVAVVSLALYVASFIDRNAAWIEWSTVALFVVYMWLLGFKTLKGSGRQTSAG
ncbi:MAG TPA: DUF998 domain-containing protein [Chloroflexota bacterium]